MECIAGGAEMDYMTLKEASETLYWLDLLQESNNIATEQYESISNDVKTIIGTLVNIINKLKQKNNQ